MAECDPLELPRLPHGTGAQAICRFLGKFLRVRIPRQLASEFERDVSAMQQGAQSMQLLNREIGVSPRTHAIQEIAMFAGRLRIEMNSVGRNNRIQYFVAARL